MRRLRGIFIADPAVILLTMGFGTVSLLASFFDKKGTTLDRLAHAWAKTMLRATGIRVHVEGLEQIDPHGSYVFAANHLSYMDTPVALACIPVQFRFLAKSGLFKIPLLGNHLKNSGHIPVPLDDPRASVKTMQLAAEKLRDKNTSLLIFPEGGRSPDGVLYPFKEGGAYIAIRAGIPIVPLVLVGTREVLPFGGAVVQSGCVTLRVLPPIDTRSMTLKDRGKVTAHLHELIARELGQAGVRAVAEV